MLSLTTLGLSLLAGALSTLAPCVLPLLPIVIATAASKHRLGPFALAAGLALSFVAIGLFIATIGFSIGLDDGVFRKISSALMIVMGLVLAIPLLSERFATAAGPVGNWAGQFMQGASADGLTGQFGVGLLLGMVWSPCVGPTLGAASLLAAQGKDLGQVALSMLVFGLGAAAPLLLLGLISRAALMSWRQRMMSVGYAGKMLLGGVLILSGLAIFTNLDRALQVILIANSPEWLTELTTRF